MSRRKTCETFFSFLFLLIFIFNLSVQGGGGRIYRWSLLEGQCVEGREVYHSCLSYSILS